VIEIKNNNPLQFTKKDTNGSKIFREILLNSGISNYTIKKNIGYYAGIDSYLRFMIKKGVVHCKKFTENGRKKHSNYVRKKHILDLIDVWYHNEEEEKRKFFKDLITSKWEEVFSEEIFDFMNIYKRKTTYDQIRDLFSQLWDLSFQPERGSDLFCGFKLNKKGADKLSKILGIDKKDIYEGYLKSINTKFIDFMIVKSRFNEKMLTYIKELIESKEHEKLFETIDIIEKCDVFSFNFIPNPRNKDELERSIEKIRIYANKDPHFLIEKLKKENEENKKP